MIHIQDFTFNSFQTRCSVVWDDSLSCAIVDPGCSSDAEISELTSFISSRGLKPVCIMLTHGHFDHVLGVADLVSSYDNLPVYMHPADKATLAGNEYFTKWFGAPLPASFETVDICEACSAEGCTDGSSECCTDGPDGPKCISVIEVGGLRFNVIETPGHTPGGVSFYEPAEKVLFSGDSLFAGAIGRTDHPGGDYEMLMKSILGKLVTLEGSVSVIPGHGPCTDIAREGMTNPFLLPFNEPYED
jgi:glyoxylase-like metal-dependent hydrolase (beta-lactamase superfamily II)